MHGKSVYGVDHWSDVIDCTGNSCELDEDFVSDVPADLSMLRFDDQRGGIGGSGSPLNHTG